MPLLEEPQTGHRLFVSHPVDTAAKGPPPRRGRGARSLWRMTAGTVLALAGLLALPALFWGPPPLSINVSESLPIGLYWTRPFPEPARDGGEPDAGALGRDPVVDVGMLVSACLPRPVAVSALERGYLPEGPCPSGTGPVGKVVVAVAGDTVDVTDSGSIVNRVLLPKSAPLRMDSKGRAMPRVRGPVVLPEGTAWLYSGHSPRSFDSRYYGPVPLSALRGRLFPLLTRGEAYRPTLEAHTDGARGVPRAQATQATGHPSDRIDPPRTKSLIQ